MDKDDDKRMDEIIRRPGNYPLVDENTMTVIKEFKTVMDAMLYAAEHKLKHTCIPVKGVGIFRHRDIFENPIPKNQLN